MSKFFDPKSADGEDAGAPTGARLYAPATTRNRDVICSVLKDYLQGLSGTLVEVASGTGEHAVHIAPHLDGILWQPTDIEEKHLHSIDAWRAYQKTLNVQAAQHFNIIENTFADLPVSSLCAIIAINLIHITPWQAAQNLIEKAGAALDVGAVLFLYGPFKRDGKHTSQSNADFDISLKSRDPDWGIRDLEAVSALAEHAGFQAPTIIDMPANNLSLIFRKA